MVQEIINVVVTEVARLIDAAPAEIGIDKPLPEIVDSLQSFQLITLLERTYRLRIDESQIEYFSTIRTLAEFVNQQLAATASANSAGLLVDANHHQ